MFRLSSVLALWLLGCIAAHAQIAVTGYAPAAVAPGKTTELTFTGQNLGDPLAVWTSFPAKVELLPAEPTQRKVKLTLEESVPLGIGGIVLANAGGVTPPQFVMIDDLASIAETANNAPTTPQDLTPPVAVDGAASGQQSDYYRLTLAQNQRIAIEVVGSRLGSDFDSVIRVLDVNGRELALADDDEGLGADSRLLYTAPAAGQYLLQVRDNRYRAGGRYRLRVGDFPLVGAAIPAGGAPGSRLTPLLVTLDGSALPATVTLPVSPFDASTYVSAKRPEGGTLGYTRIELADLPALVEIEASTKTPQGQPFLAPAALNGRLHEAKQRDRYAFALKKGERLNFQAMSRRFGSPAIVAMRVLNAADAQVAATAPTEAEEELLAFTAPEDGTYRLEVDELLGRGSLISAYRIEVSTGPLFNLVLKNDPNTKFQHLMAVGGAQFADVQVQRNDYAGAIELSPVCSRAGFRLSPSTIPAGVNELRVYILPPADFHAGELVDLRIQGKANVGPREHRTIAHNKLQLKTARPLLVNQPSWQESAIFTGYADQAAFYTVAPAMAEAQVALGAAVMIPFAFARTDANFKDVPLTLLFSGLPAGATAEVKREGNGPMESYQVTFKTAPTSPEGKHVVHWFAYTEFGGRGRVIEGDVSLVLTKPAQ
jgi:hypothetical protein